MRFPSRFLSLSSLLLSLVLLAGCEGATDKVAPVATAPEVGVKVVKLEGLNMTNRYPGTTRPLSTIEIIPEVTGIVIGVSGKAGRAVKKGDVLYTLDPEPFEAEVQRAESALQQSESALTLANVEYKMSRSLAEKQVISQLDAQRKESDREMAEAAMATAKADLLKARLQLEKTKIVAPMDGETGITNVKVGSLVNAGKDVMLKLTANQTIEVFTQVNEREHFRYVRSLVEDKAAPPADIELEMIDGSIYPHKGKINFIDNKVSPDSGTVTYRFIFPNPDGMLLGGQSVTILSTSTLSLPSIVIPQSAVQEDQSGRYVLVVDKDNIVSKRLLTMGERVVDQWIVESGLKEGDRIVVSGLLRAKAGKPVTPVEERPAQ